MDVKQVMIMVILAVVFLTSAAALYTPLTTVGLSTTELCTNSGCFYNSSRTTECTTSNMTSADTTQCTVVGSAMPFSGMFGSGGVVLLAFAAMVVILTIMVFLHKIKNK